MTVKDTTETSIYREFSKRHNNEVTTHIVSENSAALYNTPHNNTDLKRSCRGSKKFSHEISQRNYSKMTINGHFPIIAL